MLLKHIKSKKNNNIKFLSIFKNKGVIALTSVLVFILSLGVISFVTKTNVVTYITERILKELGIYTTEVRNVEIESNDYNSPGSWHIDKSAKWTGLGKAQVTFDVNSVMKTEGNYKDVVLVLDISGSMMGEKLEKARSDSKELIEYLLTSPQNRVAIITFDTNSEIISKFSNDKNDLIAKIDALTDRGNTNYNAALLNVDVVMEGYVKEENRDVITLFLTDGYPNEDTPNQLGTFEVLKDKYPYMSINGIQYEMGIDIIEEIREITDSAWVADQSTLNNVLFDASISPIIYENFIVTDYIDNDYFTINSVDDIKVSMGTVTLSIENGVQKITWNLGDNSFMTGGNAKMIINLSLKEEYVESEGYYPTNKKEKIETKLPEETIKTVNSSNTPVLKNNYEVIYDTNTPNGCTIESILPEKYFVYENVIKKQTKLSCNGYLFKGWEIDFNDSKDIKKVNDDVFVMPMHDVTIRAIWTRQSINKTMDGIVHEKPTLYRVFQKAAHDGTYAKEYTGAHQDSISGNGTKKIYHWYADDDADVTAILGKNNVIFAGHCWQMIRTTDTGGVKMIYNGEPDSEGKCGKDREIHVGYSGRTSTSLSGNYYYGTSYTYDKVAKSFSLTGEKIQETWNESTAPGLIGKYTCRSIEEDGTCRTLYYVESYYDNSSGYVFELNGNSHYSQFGEMRFGLDGSPASVGYMYNKVYHYKTIINKLSGKIEYQTEPVNQDEYNVIKNDEAYPYDYDTTTKMWVSTNHTDNATGTIEISPKTDGDYYLSYEVSSEANYDKAKIYVDNVLKDTISGTLISSIKLGTLTTSSVIKVEYTKDSSGYRESDQVKFSLAKKKGEEIDNRWSFGKDVEYKDGTYTLKNTVLLDLRTDFSYIGTNHYSCLNEEIKNPETGEISCAKVKYIYQASSYETCYIELENGIKIEQALVEMLSADNVNKTNSTIKSAIDAWYEMYMIDYSDYLEDTVFCNDRKIRDLSTWNPNGESSFHTLLFNEYYETSDLSCTNITDRFSVSNEKAKLKYKVGLMSSPEMNLLNNSSILMTGEYYWLLSPHSFYYGNAYLRVIYTTGKLFDANIPNNLGVRPAISLIPGIEYSSGDGSMDNPYVVSLLK